MEIPIPGEEKLLLFRKALRTLEKRVDAIVSEKHRRSYREAARLVAAAAAEKSKACASREGRISAPSPPQNWK